MRKQIERFKIKKRFQLHIFSLSCYTPEFDSFEIETLTNLDKI